MEGNAHHLILTDLKRWKSPTTMPDTTVGVVESASELFLSPRMRNKSVPPLISPLLQIQIEELDVPQNSQMRRAALYRSIREMNMPVQARRGAQEDS